MFLSVAYNVVCMTKLLSCLRGNATVLLLETLYLAVKHLARNNE